MNKPIGLNRLGRLKRRSFLMVSSGVAVSLAMNRFSASATATAKVHVLPPLGNGEGALMQVALITDLLAAFDELKKKASSSRITYVIEEVAEQSPKPIPMSAEMAQFTPILDRIAKLAIKLNRPLRIKFSR